MSSRSKDRGHPVSVSTTKKEVQTFLGYYCHLTPHYASLAVPLSSPNWIAWSDKCDKTYKNLLEQLCEHPVLHSPDFTNNCFTMTQTST